MYFTGSVRVHISACADFRFWFQILPLAAIVRRKDARRHRALRQDRKSHRRSGSIASQRPPLRGTNGCRLARLYEGGVPGMQSAD
jgi:hypothetical protein